MAQTIDLPEVTQATTQASTDDLLSQLAGDEIDRLLAEAEIEKPAVSAAPITEASAPQMLSDLTAPLPEPAPTGLAPQDPATPAPAITGNAKREEAVNAELDQLFNELSSDKPAENASGSESDKHPEADSAPQPAPPVVVAPSAPAPPAKTTEQPTSTQERAALKEEPAIDSHHEDEDEPAKLPIYLKPLEWLNSPLQLVPEPARDLVGKVAIITFMNAVSALAYLILFHRH